MLFVLLGLAVGVLAFAATRRIIPTVAVFLVGWAVAYLTMPVLAYGFFGLPVILLALGAGTGFLELILADSGFRTEPRWVGPVVLLGIAVVWLAVVPFFTSISVFHHDAYRSLIGDVVESTYSTDVSPVDPGQIRIIDQSLASRLADKRLGENTALGSQVKVGEMSIQKVGDQLYWVGPLTHSGMFKWLNNRDGTPGYVMVSATNERDVRLVQDLDGEPLHLKYNQGSFFGDLPLRHLYTHGYQSAGMTDFTFEIDDEGRPHWVVTRYRKAVGFFGADAIGVLVMDAETGDISEYAIHEAPAWVDRIQPEDLVVDQLDAWGRYVHGWWVQNPSCEDCLQTTPGTSLVYGDDGQAYWYTGLTSTGADDATVGFVLVGTRDKRARFYKQTGATETAAMRSAEGSVQEKGYYSTFPILYNVSGNPTYFATLKDDAGLVKSSAFVSVENYQIVGIGEDVSSALRNYRRALASRGNDLVPDGAVDYEEITGVILRMTQETKKGETYYYVLVEGADSMAFVGSSGVSVEMPLSREGDRVTIAYENGGSALVDIMEFDNERLVFRQTPSQRAVTEYGDSVRAAGRAEREGGNADAAWEALSPDEKARLLNGGKGGG